MTWRSFQERVIRRVGGLEAPGGNPSVLLVVIRRVGGLEVELIELVLQSVVIRRVGGLEVTGKPLPDRR